MIEPNTLDLSALRAASHVGAIEYHAELGSTQQQAKLLATNSGPLPHLVLASRQTAGRGRGENVWWASEGALTFSWLIDPQHYAVTPDRLASISVAVGLAICKELETVDPHCGFKWPNDVLLHGRKVCGVLIETIAGNLGNPRTIIGVGLNVNNSLAMAPPEIQQLATSLIDRVGRPFELTGLLIELLGSIDHELHRLGRADEQQPADWNARSLLADREVELETAAGAVFGRCIGLDPTGALLLANEQGVTRVLSGVVKRISPPLAV